MKPLAKSGEINLKNGNSKTIPEHCKGCRSLSADGKCWGVLGKSKAVDVFRIECPCRECLIKIMCGTICEQYAQLRRELMGW